MLETKKDKIREWSNIIKRYIALHEYIKVVGKKAISQNCSGSGKISDDVKSQLTEGLLRMNNTFLQLGQYLKPLLPDFDITDGAISKDKQELDLTKAKYENEIRDLKRELSVNQQVFARKQEIFLKEKEELQRKLAVYENEINDSDDEQEESEMGQVKKQIQLEETLKVQNDLICDLKNQLENSIKDREIFRSLNNTLQSQLKKKSWEDVDVDVEYHNLATLLAQERFKGQRVLDDPTLQSAAQQKTEKPENGQSVEFKEHLNEIAGEETAIKVKEEKKIDK